MPQELVTKIDQLVERQFINRSEFIRQAAVEKLRTALPDSQPNAALAPGVIAAGGGLNILMTDRQLEEMFEILRREKVRRLVEVEKLQRRRSYQ